MRQPVRIFVVYAPEDEELWQNLERHLALLQQENIVDWEGQRLLGGDSLDLQEQAFNSAALISNSISADFLNSPACITYMQQALQRQSLGEVSVIPILLRSVVWQGTEFPHVLPISRISVTLWPNEDEAWTNIVADLQRVIEGTPPSAVEETVRRRPFSSKVAMRFVVPSVLLLLLFSGFAFLYIHINSAVPKATAALQERCSGAKQGVTLYTRPNYMGKCYTFDIGDHDLASVGLDQVVESLRDPHAAYMVRLRDQNGRPGVFDKDMPLLTDDWIDKAHTV